MNTTNPLRVCANLKWLFTERPFLERFEAAARNGFSAVEFASPYEYSPSVLKERLDENGLQQILINTPVGAQGSPTASGTACLEGFEVATRDGVKRALEYAVALDCPMVHVMAGIVPAGADYAAAFKRYEEHIAWSVDLAATANKKVILESLNPRDVPGFVLKTQEQAVDIVRRLGSEHAGVLFDIYHCQMTQGDTSRRLEALLPYVAHVQVADPPYRTEPGTGELNWPFIFQLLKKLKYSGWVGCEYRPQVNTEEGLGWRENLLGV